MSNPTVALATTWHPRGELVRLRRLLPILMARCSMLVVSLPPEVDADPLAELGTLPDVTPVDNKEWSHGRHTALQAAFDAGADYIHYADMDRLLRWVETRPDEWRQTVDHMQQVDCLIVGRTEQAYATHPAALRQTEQVYNLFFSQVIGQTMDFSAGAKGFSRAACDFLLANSPPGRALGIDSEWPVLLHRAGFAVNYAAVDGLDWESADRYQDAAANVVDQQQAAEQYDADAANWAWRVQVALTVTQAGLAAMFCELEGAPDAIR